MNNTGYVLFWFLIILGCICILRGISPHMTKDELRSLLFGLAISWLMPVALIYGIKKQFWFDWLPRIRIIVVIGGIYVLAALLIGIATGHTAEGRMHHSADFLFLSPLLIILSIYMSNKFNTVIGLIGVIILSTHMFFEGARYAIAYTGLISVFYLAFIIFEQKRLDLKVYLFFIGSILLISYVFIAFQSPIFKTHINRYFIQGEMWTDTRVATRPGSGSLSEAVTKSMSTFELAFGKGIFGKYTWGYKGWPPVLYVRYNVEIGFKHILLKGGYVMLASFYLLSAYAAYLGLFRSRNKITKYLSIMIIAKLIIMSTAMLPRVGFEYFMYWLIVGGCLSTQLRGLDDSTIKEKCETPGSFVIRW